MAIEAFVNVPLATQLGTGNKPPALPASLVKPHKETRVIPEHPPVFEGKGPMSTIKEN